MRQVNASVLLAVLLVTGFAASVSATTEEQSPSNIKEWIAQQSRARKGAARGAAGGAVWAAIKAKVRGESNEEVRRQAILGGIEGGIAGFELGKQQDVIFAGRDAAVREARYKKSQGYIARIQKVSCDPPQPKPGDTVTLYIRYLVLGPNENEPIKVKLFRGLKYRDEYMFGLEPNVFDVPNGGAVVESTVEITLSKKAPAGTYSVEVLMESPQSLFEQAIGTTTLHIFARARSTASERR